MIGLKYWQHLMMAILAFSTVIMKEVWKIIADVLSLIVVSPNSIMIGTLRVSFFRFGIMKQRMRKERSELLSVFSMYCFFVGTGRYVRNVCVWLLGLDHRLAIGAPIQGFYFVLFFCP
jgi:hypothetical protein